MSNIKRIAIDVLDEGFVVSDDKKGVAALTPNSALQIVAEMIGASEVKAPVAEKPPVTTDDPGKEQEQEESTVGGFKPGDEVTAENRDEAVKFILDNGGEVPPRTRNTTLAKLALSVAEKAQDKDSSGAAEEAAEEQKEEVTSSDCPACGGTGKLCPNSGKDIDCPVCDKAALVSEDLRALGNAVLGAFKEEPEIREKLIKEGLQPTLAKLGVASVADVAKPKVVEAAGMLVGALDALFVTGTTETADEEW